MAHRDIPERVARRVAALEADVKKLKENQEIIMDNQEAIIKGLKVPFEDEEQSQPQKV